MKRLLTILLFLPLLLPAQPGILGVLTSGGTTTPPPTGNYVAAVNATIINDGTAAPTYNGQPTGYNAFAWPSALSDGSIVTFWKKSPDHAGKGPVYMARSTDGGATWTYRHVTVGGQGIYCTSLSNSIQAINGRIFLTYQDNPSAVNYWEDYDNISIAYIDEVELMTNYGACTFTFSETKLFTYSGPEANHHYVAAQFGKVAQYVPGEIWVPFYKLLIDFSGAYPYQQVRSETSYFVSTDNGATWTERATPVLTHNGGAFPNGHFSEVTYLTTHHTGVKATTKIVAFVRNEQYGYYTHVRSADGGATWTEDQTNLIYDWPNSGEKRPVHPILYNGTVYMFCGYRGYQADGQTPDYKLQYFTWTPDECFNNAQGGRALTTVLIPTANGGAIHWGYSEPFIRQYTGIDELIVHYYDSEANTNPTYPVCYLVQRVILSNQ